MASEIAVAEGMEGRGVAVFAQVSQLVADYEVAKLGAEKNTHV